jgi:hypothetical protein
MPRFPLVWAGKFCCHVLSWIVVLIFLFLLADLLLRLRHDIHRRTMMGAPFSGLFFFQVAKVYQETLFLGSFLMQKPHFTQIFLAE